MNLYGTGAAILIITLVSILLMFVGVGIVTIWISVIWVFVALFLILGITRKYNVALATQLEQGSTAGSSIVDRMSSRD